MLTGFAGVVGVSVVLFVVRSVRREATMVEWREDAFVQGWSASDEEVKFWRRERRTRLARRVAAFVMVVVSFAAWGWALEQSWSPTVMGIVMGIVVMSWVVAVSFGMRLTYRVNRTTDEAARFVAWQESEARAAEEESDRWQRRATYRAARQKEWKQMMQER